MKVTLYDKRNGNFSVQFTGTLYPGEYDSSIYDVYEGLWDSRTHRLNLDTMQVEEKEVPDE